MLVVKGSVEGNGELLFNEYGVLVLQDEKSPVDGWW